MEQAKINKWSVPYERDIYIVYKTKGSTIYVRRERDGRQISRDSSKFRLVKSLDEEQQSNIDQHNRRETLMRKSRRPIENHDDVMRYYDHGLPFTFQQAEVQDGDHETAVLNEGEGAETLAIDEDEDDEEEQQPRRSGRQRRRPKHLKEYITNYHTYFVLL